VESKVHFKQILSLFERKTWNLALTDLMATIVCNFVTHSYSILCSNFC